jgi:hippurate hydrolase
MYLDELPILNNMNRIKVFQICLLLLTSVAVMAQPVKKSRQLAYADSVRLVDIYKDLHQNPELGFQEIRTSGIIAREMKALGYEVITGIAKTGIAAIFRNGQGPVVMYRADMDCNSVRETTGLPYASTRTMKKDDGTETPVMHACGHDAHVTWMIGVAKIMMQLKNEWKGTLVFIGQPAEEPMTGARGMVNDGLYEKVPVPDHLFGLHTWPIPLGTIWNGPDVRMAGSDQLDVTFQGIGGHGSSPEAGRDPIVMACNAVMQYQTIISRQIAAQDAAVLTVGAIHAGVDNNVIPPAAQLKLNLRWFNEKTRNTLLDGIRRINEGIAIANGLPAEMYPSINMKSSVFPLVNDAALSGRVNTSLEGLLQPERIITKNPPVMGSEDFQHLVKPGSKTTYDYIFVGVADNEAFSKAVQQGKKSPYYNHNGNYVVELSAIPLGTAIGSTALLEIMKK